MNKATSTICLILFLTLSISCVDSEPSKAQISGSVLKTTTRSTSLKFTSGVRAILKDSKGNYWIGSHEEGVAVFDGETFRYYTINDGLPDNQIRSIKEDRRGGIWVATAKGVCRYAAGKMMNLTQGIAFDTHSKWHRTNDDLWFNAGTHSGVYRYDGQNLSYLAFPAQKIINPNNVFHVTGIAEGSGNMIWIATYAGVIGYNGSRFVTINDETLGFAKETDMLHVRSVFEDSKGRLWIGNNGIGVLLKEGDKVTNFSEKMNLIHPASSKNGDKSPAGTLEHVFVIQEDVNGNIWFGDRDTGVWKFDGKKMTNYIVDTKLPSQMAWCIYNDNDSLLFGMAEGGVYQFNGKAFKKWF